MIKFPIGNSAIITRKGNPNEFVAVCRRENPELVCFPGGKLEANEDVVTGVAREVYEETGLIIPKENFRPIYAGICEGEKEYWVTAFWVEIEDVIEFDPPEKDKFPHWTDEEKFMKHTSYPIFNKLVFEQFNKLK